jgi:hypothetical protein
MRPSEISFPSRHTHRETIDPGPRELTRSASWSGPLTGRSSSLVMMSPSCMPAFSAGLPSLTPATSTPAPR